MKGNYSNYKYAFIQKICFLNLKENCSLTNLAGQDRRLQGLRWLPGLVVRSQNSWRGWGWGGGREVVVISPGGQSGQCWSPYRGGPRPPCRPHRWWSRLREVLAASESSLSAVDRRCCHPRRLHSGPAPSCSSLSGRSQHSRTPRPGRRTGNLWNKQLQRKIWENIFFFHFIFFIPSYQREWFISWKSWGKFSWDIRRFRNPYFLPNIYYGEIFFIKAFQCKHQAWSIFKFIAKVEEEEEEVVG